MMAVLIFGLGVMTGMAVLLGIGAALILLGTPRADDLIQAALSTDGRATRE